MEKRHAPWSLDIRLHHRPCRHQPDRHCHRLRRGGRDAVRQAAAWLDRGVFVHHGADQRHRLFLSDHRRHPPAQIVGGISLAILAVAIAALYGLHLAGPWRWIYVVAALMALYLNTFVAVIQAFQKIAFLKALAPTQSEPPFLVAQTAVLVAFLALGYLATRKFHPAAVAA
jgi:hypothetical protein